MMIVMIMAAVVTLINVLSSVVIKWFIFTPNSRMIEFLTCFCLRQIIVVELFKMKMGDITRRVLHACLPWPFSGYCLKLYFSRHSHLAQLLCLTKATGTSHSSSLRHPSSAFVILRQLSSVFASVGSQATEGE